MGAPFPSRAPLRTAPHVSMHIRALLLAALSCVLAACGGGGGSSSPGPIDSGVSAGANLTISAGDRVYITPSANPSAQVVSFTWTQISGPEAALEGDILEDPSTLIFRAPAFATALGFEVAGVRADGSVAGRDSVSVLVTSATSAASGTALSTTLIRGGGEGRALATAFHAASQRLFVIDELAGDVLCYDVSNPAAPSFVGVLPIPADVPGFQAAGPLAVGCGDSGPIAIAWSGQTIKFPGRMQFVDPTTLQETAAFSTVGVRPVDIDANDAGTLFAVACAGDRDFFDQANGLGYVTLFTVPPGGPGTIEPHLHIAPIPMTAFDGDEAQLAAEGVRFFGGAPQASLQLDPRAVAVAPDSSVVWVSCPVANAVLTIDPVTKLVTGITAMPDRPNADLTQGTSLAGSARRWSQAPTLAVSPAGDPVPLGGIAGVLPPNGSGTFRFVTGSGPTLATVDLDGDGVRELPYVDPSAQLAVEEFVFLGASGTIEPFQSTPLVGSGGVPVVGAPNVFTSSPGLAGHDERAIDLFGAAVPPSSFGGRFEGATQTPNGDLWLADSRRCSLWRFSSGGQLIERFSPVGTLASLGAPILPAVFGQRRVNLDFPLHRRFGGFGGVAFDPTRNALLAIPRLPLDNPDVPSDASSSASRILRILEFSLGTQTAVGEYVYVLDGLDHAVEGIAAAPTSVFAGGFAVLEAGLGGDALRGVFDVDLDGATNLRALSAADYAAVSAVLESTAPGALGDLTVPVVPVTKRLAVDLTAAGFGGDARPSDLFISGPNELLVCFDDGFAGATTAGFDPSTGAIFPGTSPGSFFVRGAIEPLRYDTAADGLPAPLSGGVPAIGLPQPLDLVAVGSGDGLRVLTANGGRARVLPFSTGGGGADERLRAADQVLDSNVFPGASLWQRDPFGGDLTISDRDADLDGDGLVDRLAMFGSRSLSSLDAERRVRWTSSGLLNDRARSARPAAFDAASTGFGLRPRALDRAVIDGRTVVATAFEGAGLVGVHVVDNVDAPLFLGFVASGGSPCDVDLVPESGGGSALMVVTDRAAGSVSMVRIQL